LSPAQTRYTTTERELLSIVETLKEFRNILLGQQIIVNTDHENLTYKKFNSYRVMRWRLFIEEYSPDLRYVKGELNIVADALSRLELNNQPKRKEADFTEKIMSQLYCYAKSKKQQKKEQEESCPLSYQEIGRAQADDKQLLDLVVTKPQVFQIKKFYSAGKTIELICHNDKIVIAESQQLRVVDWYHNYLGHPGINRTEETICQHLWWPKMRDHITIIVSTCISCQKNKRRHKKYGHLPEKLAETTQWDRLCVDLIGPYTIRQKGQ